MKKKTVRILIILGVVCAAVAGLLFAYLEMRQERDLEASAEAPVIAPSRLERDEEGGPVLRLDEATENLLGLQVALPVTGSVKRELIAPARVLDGAGLAAQLNELHSAQTALAVARADFERKTKLFEKGNLATASAVEQAEALVKQQVLAVELAHDQMIATWSLAVTEREDLADFARRLVLHESALVRVDMIASGQRAPAPPVMRLRRLDGEVITTAQVLGPAPITDSVVAGRSLLGLVETNAVTLIPGSRLTAHFDSGATMQGTVLPRSAVVRNAGIGWVYVQTSPHLFSRRRVSLETPHPDGWLVDGDWTQPVVIAGGQSLLSEELKGSIQMKD